MADRVPYFELTPAEREAIHTWLHDHRVSPDRVPVDAQFRHDPATGEWRIPMFWTDARGSRRLDPVTGDVRMLIVRRRQLWPLPWRARLSVSFNGVDLTPYVKDVQLTGGDR